MMLRIGTRGSELALWQAHFTQNALRAIGIESELVIIKTKGDQIQHLGFDKMEGTGFFTKEIEDALLAGTIDVAVHSMKDLPTRQPDGLVITAVSYREDPADWLFIRRDALDTSRVLRLKTNAVVGTSASRRKAQMLDIRPDVTMKDIRGNVPTRLEKLRQGDFDAIFLAAAGVKRLGLNISDFEVVRLDPREFIPAPAQGVLAWQTLRDDTFTRTVLKKIHHPEVSAVTNVERQTLRLMGGGCHEPLGVHCYRDANGFYHVHAACQLHDSLHRAYMSSNTHSGLAERLVERLKAG
jgi:hydroxymethylbilane synthase